MPELMREVKTFKTKLMCINCTYYLREMSFTGKKRLLSSPEFEYKCNKCGHTEFSAKEYPLITYEEI